MADIQNYASGNNIYSANASASNLPAAGTGVLRPEYLSNATQATGGLSIVPSQGTPSAYERYLASSRATPAAPVLGSGANSLLGDAAGDGYAYNLPGADGSSAFGGSGDLFYGGGGGIGVPVGLNMSDLGRLNTARNEAQIALAENAVKQSNWDTTIGNMLKQQTGIFAPSSQSYKDAMSAYTNAITQGKNEALGYLSQAADLSDEELDKVLSSIQDNYGSAIQSIQDNYGIGINELKDYVNTANENINQNFGDAINTYSPLTDIADESIQAYKDAVLSDFQGQFDAYQNSPVYQFGLQEGQNAIENAAASKGALQSGATLKALNKYSTDYASQQFNNYYNSRMGQLSNLANLASTGLTGVAGLQSQQGTLLANLNAQTGGNLASLYQGQGQDLSNLYTGQSAAQQTAYENNINRLYGAYAQKGALASQASQSIADKKYEGTLGAGTEYQVYNQLSGKRVN